MVAWPEAQASKVRHVNLEQMSERAATIFSGRCIEVGESLDPVLGTTVTTLTFKVDRAVKGDPGNRITIRMLGGLDTGSRRAGLPAFERGEQVVLFLYGTSPLGLTSPVGLGQGKFVVRQTKGPRRVAQNAVGNRGLFAGLSGKANARLGRDSNASEDGNDLDADLLLDMAERLGR